MKLKHLLLPLFAGIMYGAAYAQPVIKHQRTIGGTSPDWFSCLNLTGDGGLIAGGSSNSNISYEKTENRRGEDNDFDFWILKLDNLGNIQWDKTIGGSNGDFLSSVQQTSDGGYILGGYSYSNISAEKTEDNKGPLYTPDYWVVKLNSAGNIEWDKTLGGNDIDQLFSLEQTTDGGYILGGTSNSNISGNKTENSRGSDDYWIVKLDSVGNVEWDKTMGGTSFDLFGSLKQTRDGGYIIGGLSPSDISAEKTENSRGEWDYWVLKLDNLGNIQWDKTIGGNSYDDFSALDQTLDGGYILGGSSYSDSSFEKTENKRGGLDYWVVKLDSTGKIESDKTIGGNNPDHLNTVQQTSDGGYILGGNSSSNISGEKTENSRCECADSYEKYDYWVVKLDGRGNIQWDKTIGGNRDDLLESIQEVEKNRYIFGGTSSSKISGEKTQPSRGHEDYWLVELKYIRQNSLTVATLPNVSNLKATATTTKQFIIYPNPAKDVLHVQINGKAIVSLTNQAGKILLTKTIEGTGVINVTSLPAGLYYLKNTLTGEVQKVVVTK